VQSTNAFIPQKKKKKEEEEEAQMPLTQKASMIHH
jgi:hypothetical protein